MRLVDEVFFGGERHRFNAERLSIAREVCEHCPVLFECLDYIVSVPACHDRAGIYAGLLPEERATLREVASPRVLYREDVFTGGDAHGERSKRRQRSA